MVNLLGAKVLKTRRASSFGAIVLFVTLYILCVTAARATPPETASAQPPAGGSAQATLRIDWPRSVPVILTPVLSGIFGLGGTWLALRFGYRNTKETLATTRATNEAAINQKANEAELQSIGFKLSSFYGPYVQRSGENALLAAEFHARRKPGFRTLLALLEPGWLDNLSKADRTIVCEIVDNGIALRALIRDQAGMVDQDVRAYLARAGVHFTMLSLAKEGSLENDTVRFGRYVYPRQLDEVLLLDMERLKRRADTLRREPSAKHEHLQTLIIPPHLALPEWPQPPGKGASA